MAVAQNNVAGVENNYLNNCQFLCKMSPDEIVGISAYMAEKLGICIIEIYMGNTDSTFIQVLKKNNETFNQSKRNARKPD